jgi:hypothetical protein
MLIEYTILIHITITYECIKHITTQEQYEKFMLDSEKVAKQMVKNLDKYPRIEYNYHSDVIGHLYKYGIDRVLMNSDSDSTETFIESELGSDPSTPSSSDTQTEINERHTNLHQSIPLNNSN